MEKIDNIIFDLGGVLVGLDAQRCISAFEKLGAEAIVRYVKEKRTEDLFYDAEIGNINQSEFCQRVRQMTHSDLTDDQIVWAWNQLLTVIPDYKKERLLQLRQNYHLYLLSNTNDMHWEHCARHLFPWRGHTVDDYFDCIFLSYQMHLAKPSDAIFAEVVRQTAVNPARTLFVDDSLENCQTAQRMGMKTLHNKTLDYWMNEL